MACIFLNDGTVFYGRLFGSKKVSHGEIVFQTGMVGYVESLTDPSYFNQVLVLTYPLIGNYGVPSMDETDSYGLPKHFESNRIWLSGLVVSSCTPDGEHSHYSAVKSLSSWLKEHDVVGIEEVDTRALTKHLRNSGTMTCSIYPSNVPRSVDNDTHYSEFMARYRSQKLLKEPLIFKNDPNSPWIIAVDCGIKNNQLRSLLKYGLNIKVVSFDYDFIADMSRSDVFGLYLSNGPGDPADYVDLIANLRKIIKKKINKPVMGICLGNQLLAIAAGFETVKMKFGNRGHNHPCRDTITGRCFITSQNHGYAVNYGSQQQDKDWKVFFENINDKTNEGIYHSRLPFFSVQFHPEHAAGPRDMEILFMVYYELVTLAQQGKLNESMFQECYMRHTAAKCGKIEKKINCSADARPLRVLILGSGGLSIGQAGEFDYSGSQAIKALKEENCYTILINPNIATVQTTKGLADTVYLLPVTAECVKQVIDLERPDGILLSFGGQTALNCGLELDKLGILKEYDVKVLGTQVDSIRSTEDRGIFAAMMKDINEFIAPSATAYSVSEAISIAASLDYPVMIRAGFALGGKGSGFAYNESELTSLVKEALLTSPQIIIDKSLLGWKEVEYEVVRDIDDNTITVCNMENFDPLGIHTGESIVVSPSQTLNDYEYNLLRSVAIKVVRHLAIVGECNIQFAFDPFSDRYYIIEVNARLSRSSALASKATGYPLAYISCKLALGYTLPELKNLATSGSINGEKVWTSACFEPSLDYLVVKMPRWDMDKFSKVSKIIGTSMKSVGEVMAIGRTFEEAIQKAIRMTDVGAKGFESCGHKYTVEGLRYPCDKRIFFLASALENGVSIEEIYQLTKIDKWFLNKLKNIVNCRSDFEKLVKSASSLQNIGKEDFLHMKRMGFSDLQISSMLNLTCSAVRSFRLSHSIVPFVRQIDTVAAEFPATTNYLYTTYNSVEHDVSFKVGDSKSVLVIGSGVYRIGSSVEFDYCSVACIKELKRIGYRTIMLNYNPETVSTDYDECDRLYFDEISLELVADIYFLENPLGVIISMGGQLPNNIAMSLKHMDINILGTSPEMIDAAENRFKFSRLMDSIAIEQPIWKELTTFEEAKKFCSNVGFPCLVRPSYVLSGAAMKVASDADELKLYLRCASIVSKDYPVVISKFIVNAKEIDVDAVAHKGKIICIAVSEHIENAGTHSGDASLVLPAQGLNEKTQHEIYRIAYDIAGALHVTGPFNLQLIAVKDSLKVIECNLRVSRSFPFVSKVLDCDFVGIATRVIMGVNVAPIKHYPNSKKVAVKVPQFSFSQLKNADVRLGVEMASTGEVACFGSSLGDAYLKALISAGFKIPVKKNIFVSVGPYKAKLALVKALRSFEELGYKIYGTKGSSDFYASYGISIKCEIFSSVEAFDSVKTDTFDVKGYLQNRKIDLIINIPLDLNSKEYRDSTTLGYKIRRFAADYSVPLLMEKNNVKMLIQSLINYSGTISICPTVDTLLTRNIIRIPGLIDVHVHMREPGTTHKEDFYTGTRAALAGGITTVLCMPNTKPPLIDMESFEHAKELASSKAVCDYGFYFGATENNCGSLDASLFENCFGMKMYLNDTFTELKLNNFQAVVEHINSWPKNSSIPILVHAEGATLSSILYLVWMYSKPVHVCHISTKEEILLIKQAKMANLPVTCEVTPHHLILTEEDFGQNTIFQKSVKPRLCTKEDQNALWENLKYIDCFATDHAPHTLTEKKEFGYPGFPGLETIVPLLFQAVSDGRLTVDDIVEKMYTNPIKIFKLPFQPETYVDVELGHSNTLLGSQMETKAKWTPFEGFKLAARVLRVIIRGKTVMVAGKIISKPGSGHYIRPLSKAMPEVVNQISVSKSVEKFVPEAPVTEIRGSKCRIRELLDAPSSKSFRNKGFVSVVGTSRSDLRYLFSVATEIRMLLENGEPVPELLKGKVIALAFFEPSTRTMLSFQTAVQRLGGTAFIFTPETSSLSKGESFDDTIRVLASFADLIVIRHSKTNILNSVIHTIKVPIINAGDGIGSHPTQALLDCFTIREEIGTVNNVKIAFVGDLKNGRTVHSLAQLLTNYENIELSYVSPGALRMPAEIKAFVEERRPSCQKDYDSIEQVICTCDVIYMTRIQKERFATEEEYMKYKGSLILTPSVLTKAKPKMVILHPLPRVDEISTEVDDDSRAVYFKQVKYGMYVRMALLAAILNKNGSSS